MELSLNLSNNTISVLYDFSDDGVTPVHESNLLALSKENSVILLQEDFLIRSQKKLVRFINRSHTKRKNTKTAQIAKTAKTQKSPKLHKDRTNCKNRKHKNHQNTKTA